MKHRSNKTRNIRRNAGRGQNIRSALTLDGSVVRHTRSTWPMRDCHPFPWV